MAVLTACRKKSDDNTFSVTFIDVGKGDCIVISCGESTLMIDTGYDSTSESVLEHLKQMEIDHLDKLIVTHYDKDHAGGAAKIIGSVPVSEIYLPGYESGSSVCKEVISASEKGGNSAKVTEDVSFTLGTAEFAVYAADIEYTSGGSKKDGNDNDVSLVVSAVNGKDSYLFAGDIEKPGIKSFLNKCGRSFDVIKMPHHGKKESNTDKLIDTVKPKKAVITDSADEPADKKTLSLLENADVYRSSVSGDITIESSGNGKYKVTAEK